MEIPEWLDQCYIEQILRTFHKNTSLKVYDLHVIPALGKGENFGGLLTRIKVKYQFKDDTELRNADYVVKTSFDGDEFASEKMKPYDIFNREMSIYENVLPKLQQLLNDINDEDQMFAKAIHVDYQRQALIFEDLSVHGYIMADRIQRLDMQHVELILRKLAKMHATSAVLNERENGCLESYDRGFFNRYTNSYSTYFVGTLMACGRFLQQWPDYSYYANKLLALEPHYMEIGKKCFIPIQGHVNVPAHGDVWTNNVMFKYDKLTGQPIDVIIIDFQYSFWGSPTLDLHHLFNTSLKEHLRQHLQDVLFQFYHQIFIDTLRRLHYQTHPIPNLRQFRLQAEQKRFFAFHSTCIIQPVMINKDNADADFNALMAEDERALKFKSNLYKNENVQEILKQQLPIFDRRGLLDIDQCD